MRFTNETFLVYFRRACSMQNALYCFSCPLARVRLRQWAQSILRSALSGMFFPSQVRSIVFIILFRNALLCKPLLFSWTHWCFNSRSLFACARFYCRNCRREVLLVKRKEKTVGARQPIVLRCSLRWTGWGIQQPFLWGKSCNNFHRFYEVNPLIIFTQV